MISLKEALEEVKKNFLDLYGENITDIRLEEIDNRDIDDSYQLTVSFLMPEKNLPTSLGATLAVATRPYSRLYKRVSINREDGTIINIKIYKDE
ncbi:MAG: hypothetical protein ABUK01_16715 [Leptospirales bacterium]